jgi:histidinol-phosphate aminotransferase
VSVNRRTFLANLGVGAAASGAGLISVPLISMRGREALAAPPQVIADRKADRRLAAQPGMIRIDSNENPVGPGKKALDAIRAHLNEANRYPVLSEDDVINTIAKQQGVAADQVILGCGSGELLRAAVQTFTSKDLAYVGAAPTFESPGEFAKFTGAQVRSVPVNASLGFDLDAMAAACRGAGLVYFCNPNNPTATVVSKSDTIAFIEKVNRASPETTILVDEAYFEYVANPGFGTVIPLAVNNPRVVVLRTFSKVFGMAGLRAGFAVGRADVMARMKSWTMGSNISQLTLVAAVAALEDKSHIEAEVKRNKDVRAYTMKFFADGGYKMSEGDANFVMVDIRRPAGPFKSACLQKGVAVGRAFPALPTFSRITFGTMPEMAKAAAIFKDLLGKPA